MRNWRQFLQLNINKQHQPSIAKDDTESLANLSEFFAPQFNIKLSISQGILLVLIWTFFTTGFKVSELISLHAFWSLFVLEAVIVATTILPAVLLIKLQQEQLKRMSITKVVMRVILTTTPIAIVASLVILFIANQLNFFTFQVKEIFIRTALHAINTTILTSIVLYYLIHKFQEMQLLKQLFVEKLNIQNEHIKTRLAPHFFFNTINSLASLVETDTQKASELIQHVSHLFRSSFNEPKESSFEEEIKLCEHYLAIEHYRLQDKLVVVWHLPDEDLMYDMSITSLTLQNVLEQTVLHVVERTTDQVFIHVQVSWQNHIVTIIVSADLPKNELALPRNMIKNLDFSVQQSRLREHFGSNATIVTNTTDNQVINTITYPLHDAFT